MSDISSIPAIKIILVGNASVGKTCLISSFFSQPFDTQFNPTVAPSYSSADLVRKDGLKVSLQIWDTAGQERYHSVGKLFYRDADVALVCYHPGDQLSVDAISMWVESIREEAENAKICLVLTKSDLLNSGQLQQLEMEANGFAVQYHAQKLFVTSALNGTGVKELFQECAEICDIPIPVDPTPVPNNTSFQGCGC